MIESIEDDDDNNIIIPHNIDKKTFDKILSFLNHYKEEPMTFIPKPIPNENKISTLVEKHLPPKMNKKDLMKMISEAEKESPVIEPRIKPDVKPERQIPQTPYQPKHKPAPKAEDVPQWLTFGAIGINLK